MRRIKDVLIQRDCISPETAEHMVSEARDFVTQGLTSGDLTLWDIHVMDSLMDYSEQKLFTNYSDALHEYQCAVNEAESDNRIQEVFTREEGVLYYQGDESSVKIFIEELILRS